jgi:ribosomal protein S18 acetylase RimI-like enzyme
MIKFEAYKDSQKVYLWDTYVQAMKPHIELIWGWEDNWQKNDFEQNLIKYQTLVLNFKNSKIGYIQLSNSSKELFINMLILSPSWQSMGLGKSILEKIMYFKPNNKLRLKCFKINQQAYEFYHREGFSIIDSDDDFLILQKDIL